MFIEPPSAGANHATGMRHHFHYDLDGSVHVDSILNGERWQHHVHTAQEFVRWCTFVPEDSLVLRKPAPCNCDLAPGQVIEGNGRIWRFPEFAEEMECTWHE